MLIEVMIGAVILALATTAVLNGIDGAQKTGGRNKARSVAATLAEQDQERMRSLPVSQLVSYVTTPLVRPVKVKGVDYSVKSLATWATDPGGVTTSCSSTTKTQANLRIVSQVTSPLTRGTVDLASLVTPPPGAGFSTGEGRIIVKVVDRDQAPIQGVTVNLTGPNAYSDATNAAGCAVFPFVPAGNYTASASSVGLVGWQGESPVTKATSSTAGISTAMTLEMDQPSTFNVNFVVGNTATAAKSQFATVTNANLTAPGTKTFEAVPAGSPNLLVTAAGLYPFIGTYGIYAGPCATNNPANAPTSSLALLQTFSPTPNQTFSPNPKIKMPPINVRVINSAGTLVSASPFATVTVKENDANCSTVFPPQTSNTSGALPEPGFPYGTYKICAQRTVAGTPAVTSHGHADVRAGGYATSTTHVDDVVSNVNPAGNPTVTTTDLAIQIRLSMTGPCE